MLDAYENSTLLNSVSDVGLSQSESDKRELFLRETQQFTCLRRVPELNKLVDSVVASWYLEPTAVSSRKWHRIPYAGPIGLTTIDLSSKKMGSELQIVESRNLSIEGISFSHQNQIGSREVAVTFDLEKPVMEFLVVRLAWSRFSEDRLFQSGGKFLFQVEAAAAEFID